ncbi:MAG: hypothetical protein RL509_1549 [Pseudomonadota bacterium]|jgi:hypothetical protein
MLMWMLCRRWLMPARDSLATCMTNPMLPGPGHLPLRAVRPVLRLAPVHIPTHRLRP